jgi:hypothetical protein
MDALGSDFPGRWESVPLRINTCAAVLGSMATMSVVAVKALAALGIAAAGVSAAAHSGFAPGIATALSHVPTWTHGHSVLQDLQTALQAHHHPGSRSGPP